MISRKGRQTVGSASPATQQVSYSPSVWHMWRGFRLQIVSAGRIVPDRFCSSKQQSGFFRQGPAQGCQFGKAGLDPRAVRSPSIHQVVGAL